MTPSDVTALIALAPTAGQLGIDDPRGIIDAHEKGTPWHKPPSFLLPTSQ